jgi:drug/metabolite transporter (DMT)-like permease
VNATWIPLALLCAFSLATSDALAKRALQRHNEYVVLWLRLLLASPILLATLFFIPIPKPAPEFYRAMFTALPLEAVASILYIRALKVSPLSLTLPLLALTPVFLLVVPFLLLGEHISAAGAGGVLLISAGTYFLNPGTAKKGLLEPFRAIMREQGARYMLGVALIYSVTTTLGKQAVTSSSPLLFAALYIPALTLVLTPVALRQGKSEIRGMPGNGVMKAVLLPALFYAVMVLTHMTAISMTNVAYVISIKRLSLLVGVLYGHLLFGEEGAVGRVTGTILMLCGVALITLFP